MPPGLRPPSGRAGTARPPAESRVSQLRASRTPGYRAASPAESMIGAASAGSKRKERDFDADGGSSTPGPTSTTTTAPQVEDTNINVVVRCRGRNEREVRENSAVVVRTDGVRGDLVELSMGPNALANKSYSFDRVFSPAADQSMIFEDVVKPMLDQMLSGYNCTIFAYGQTGTGKTYTMSGDMTETMGLLSDGAGIIPRVLRALFEKMQVDDVENFVKCSFIELYNEELRDLISAEDTANKLKIYDDTTTAAAARRGGHHATTVVQGMEEKHIKSAADGIRVLQEGSLKRRVAATKCNDLSSRSHTVFTITAAHVRRRHPDGGDDFVTTGKLNLVDLAGSENIQRSGAENKRAAEAGLINKSLLTLGRVINALVDRSPHIPYRESKLTRLLQDSLGGRTKTCIIATVSPAKVNLEETISTLDYAFRAKNIRNKPQVNLLLNRHVLLQDLTAEIERLKSDLIATRQRNGVYLSNDAYEDMSADRESRRIVMEEQSARIETLEANLRGKVHELFELTATFVGARRDHEATRARLDETRGVLDRTELVLNATRRSLDQETALRRAHEDTERRLADVGGQLIGSLRRTVADVGRLHTGNERRADLHALNRDAWAGARDRAVDVAALVERHARDLEQRQADALARTARRVDDFVASELAELAAARESLDEQLGRFSQSRRLLADQQDRSRTEMDAVLDEIKDVRDAVKTRFGASLRAIAGAAERMADDVVADMAGLHDGLHQSYASLGRDCKAVFEDLMKHVAVQRAESESLRQQLEAALGAAAELNAALSHRLQQAVADERRAAAEDRQRLLAQVAELVGAQADAQQARLAARGDELQRAMREANAVVEGAVGDYGVGIDAWNAKEDELLEEVRQGRDKLKTKLKDDWTTANKQSTAIQDAAKAVHTETVRIVDDQIQDLDVQMHDLDDFVTRAHAENSSHHALHTDSLAALSSAATASFDLAATNSDASLERISGLGTHVLEDLADACAALGETDTLVLAPLRELRENLATSEMREYEPTGQTPRKAAFDRSEYDFPTTLPRTAPHATILAEMDVATAPDEDDETLAAVSPGKPPVVFSDNTNANKSDRTSSASAATTTSTLSSLSSMSTTTTGLREVNPNVDLGANIASTGPSSLSSAAAASAMPPPPEGRALLKRNLRGTGAVTNSGGTSGGGGTTAVVTGAKSGIVRKLAGGLENVPPGYATGGRRKSPRLN